MKSDFEDVIIHYGTGRQSYIYISYKRRIFR
jgi:hypothetical protein